MTSNEQESPLKSNSDYVQVLDEAIEHIANAHRLIEAVRKSAQIAAKGERTPFIRDIGRVWSAVDIAGTLCSSVHRNLQARETED